MATSTMIENIKINNPRVLEEYAAALEESEKAEIKSDKEVTSMNITDSKKLKDIMLRGIENWGRKD